MWSKIARKVLLIDRGLENRQHGNKPYFTRVSLPFSAGNTAATAGNMLLLFLDSVRGRNLFGSNYPELAGIFSLSVSRDPHRR
jgi:hypothetical protein